MSWRSWRSTHIGSSSASLFADFVEYVCVSISWRRIILIPITEFRHHRHFFRAFVSSKVWFGLCSSSAIIWILMQWRLIVAIVLRRPSLSFLVWWTTTITTTTTTKLLQLALFSASRSFTRLSNRVNFLRSGSRRSLRLRIRVIFRVVRVRYSTAWSASFTRFLKVGCVRNILLTFPVSKLGNIRNLHSHVLL